MRKMGNEKLKIETGRADVFNFQFSIFNLPPVAQMMREAGIKPKKSLGQNFLFDLNLTRKIAHAVPDIKNSVIIEVGPGPGGLTRALLAAGAKRVIAIEKDKSTKPILDKIIEASDGRMEVVYGDALEVENEKWEFENYAICSNLPYNIGTELLVQWLHKPNWSSMTLMFQREVAERIVAKVGDRQYGRLSVLVALVADARILFNVPNTVFVPAPKVQNAVVQIVPRKDISVGIEKVERLTAKLFGNRRKMIRGILSLDWPAFGLRGTERAEELSPERFAEIARKIMV